jgi:hypothetical protein
VKIELEKKRCFSIHLGLLPLLVGLYCHVSYSQGSSLQADEARYARELARRYEDFFRHRRIEAKANKDRESAKGKYKADFEQRELQAEIARQEFIKNRQKRLDPSSPELEAQWNLEYERRQRQAKQVRQEFALRQARLRRLEERTFYISPELEYGIFPQARRSESEIRRRRQLELQSPNLSPSRGGMNYRSSEPESDMGARGQINPDMGEVDSMPQGYDPPINNFEDVPPEPPPMDDGMEGGDGGNIWDF